MDELKKQIMAYISQRNNSHATLEKLKSNINDSKLDSALCELVKTGDLILYKKKYKINYGPYFSGKVLINRYGAKYIFRDNGHHIPINYSSLYSVLKNDVVKYRLIDGEAYICEIVNRDIVQRPFQVILKNNRLGLEYTDGNFSINDRDIDLSPYQPGDILLIDLNELKVVRKITSSNDPLSRDIVLGYNYGFDNYYSEAYLKELNDIPDTVNSSDITQRVDFRNDLIYTTDCDNTRDIDDATGVKLLPNGNYLFSGHIASISEVIPFMSEICQTAFKRGNSAYTQRSVFPMYHPLISNGICSLNPHVDRLTKSIILEIDRTGRVVNSKLCYGVINSKMKFKYSEVDKLLTHDPSVDPEYLPFYDNLHLFKELTDIMGSYLINHGKLELANRDVAIEYNGMNVAEKCLPQEGPISRKMIEYSMIYINWQWTKILMDCDMPLIFRNHPKPTPTAINNIINNLNELGFDTSSCNLSGNFKDFLATIDQNPLEYLLATEIILRNLDMASFSHASCGHFGLGFKKGYATFSSGIRKSSDTFNHYSTDAYLRNDNELRDKLTDIAPTMAKIANDRERSARKLEEESLKYDLLDIAASNIGNSYSGLVIDIRYNRVVVKLSNGLYGFLPDDHYLSCGDKIIAQIEEINTNRKEIYLKFLGLQEKHNAKYKKRKRVRVK